jgi:hypothetical protein
MKGMFTVLATLLLATAVLAAAPSAAQAQPILAQRCNEDRLTPAQAEARLQWARRCALVVNVRNPVSWFDTFVPSANGAGNLKEYVEYDSATNVWGQNSYIGQLYGFEVNYTVTSMLYVTGATSQFIDSHGFYIWERPVGRKKVRPLYPIYGNNFDVNVATPLFPHPLHANNCLFYSNKAGDGATNPSPFYVLGFCESVP